MLPDAVNLNYFTSVHNWLINLKWGKHATALKQFIWLRRRNLCSEVVSIFRIECNFSLRISKKRSNDLILNEKWFRILNGIQCGTGKHCEGHYSILSAIVSTQYESNRKVSIYLFGTWCGSTMRFQLIIWNKCDWKLFECVSLRHLGATQQLLKDWTSIRRLHSRFCWRCVVDNILHFTFQ